MKDEKLIHAVNEKSTPTFMTTKSQIVEYYKDTYGKNWTPHAATALSGTTDKKSTAYKSAMRQFQGDRLSKVGRSAPKFEALGKKLPAIARVPKDGSITLTVKGTQGNFKRGQRVGTRQRTITATLTGTEAYSFVNDPSYADFYEAYGVDGEEFEDGEYAIDVETVS